MEAQKVNTLFNVTTFRQLLSNPTGAHMFRTFLKMEQNEDNIDFYISIDNFKSSKTLDKKMSGNIYSTFVHEGAEREINITDEDRLKVIDSLKKPTLDMFDQIQKYILMNMYNDSYRRFLQYLIQRKIQAQLQNSWLDERKERFLGLGDCFCMTQPSLSDDPIVGASDGFVKVTGYDRDEIIGKNCRFLQREGTDRESVKRISHALKNNKEVSEILLNFKKDGTPFWNLLYICPLSSPGKTTTDFFLGGQVDITSNVNNESPLRELLEIPIDPITKKAQINSEQKEKSKKKSKIFNIFKRSSGLPASEPAELKVVDPVKSVEDQKETFLQTYTNFIVLDSLMENTISYIGKKFTDITGFTHEEVYGKSLNIFNGPLTSKKFKKDIKEALRTTTPYSQDIVSYHKDGSAFMNHFYLTPLMQKERKPRFFVCVMKWELLTESEIENMKFKLYSDSNEENVDCLIS